MANIRQTACHWCYNKGPLTAEQHAARLKADGFYGVEMPPRELVPIARAAGLVVQNISGARDLRGLNNPDEHPEALRLLRDAITFASANNIPHVLAFSGPRANLSDEQGITHCAAALTQVAREAESANVTILLEVLCQQNHPGYQADNSRFAFDVVKRVASPNVQVLYDIYHMYRMGEDVAAAIAQNVDWVGHLHIAGSPDRGFPGPDQQIDYASVVQGVLTGGYRGCWGQEFLSSAEATHDELAAARRLFADYAAAVNKG